MYKDYKDLTAPSNHPFLPSPLNIKEHVWNKEIIPLVTIRCNTYMHASYIRDAIEGFLMQETTFKVEILIHDDASTDGTADIVREYEAKYPQLIKATCQIENQYKKNPKTVKYIKPPPRRGKYIAMCEGDDYWTDPLKLQKQVEFLEKNPEYVVCYHDAIIIDEKGVIINNSKMNPSSKRDYTQEDLVMGKTFILTLSLCMRNIYSIIEWPSEAAYVISGDNFLHIVLGQFGKGKYFHDIKPAVYRRHEGGIWSSMNKSEVHFNKIRTHFWIHKYLKRIGYEKASSQHYSYFLSWAVLTGKTDLKYLPRIQSYLHKIEMLLIKFVVASFRTINKILPSS